MDAREAVIIAASAVGAIHCYVGPWGVAASFAYGPIADKFADACREAGFRDVRVDPLPDETGYAVNGSL